ECRHGAARRDGLETRHRRFRPKEEDSMAMSARNPARVYFVIALVWLACVPILHAQQITGGSTALTPVPRVVWFSGSFRPADGLPVTAVETVTLAVYRDQEGGNALWQE